MFQFPSKYFGKAKKVLEQAIGGRCKAAKLKCGFGRVCSIVSMGSL